MKIVHRWERLPDHKDKGKVIHEVRCPICKLQNTYLGDDVPNFCYICDERREV